MYQLAIMGPSRTYIGICLYPICAHMKNEKWEKRDYDADKDAWGKL